MVIGYPPNQRLQTPEPPTPTTPPTTPPTPGQPVDPQPDQLPTIPPPDKPSEAPVKEPPPRKPPDVLSLAAGAESATADAVAARRQRQPGHSMPPGPRKSVCFG